MDSFPGTITVGGLRLRLQVKSVTSSVVSATYENHPLRAVVSCDNDKNWFGIVFRLGSMKSSKMMQADSFDAVVLKMKNAYARIKV